MKAVVPGKWSIYLKHGKSELNVVFLRGESSLGSSGCAGLLPRRCEHTFPPSKTAGVQDSQGQKGRV